MKDTTGNGGIDVFVGIDVAKAEHYACAITAGGEQVLARPVPNTQIAITGLIDEACGHGAVALVIDTTSATASLLIQIAAEREIPVA